MEAENPRPPLAAVVDEAGWEEAELPGSWHYHPLPVSSEWVAMVVMKEAETDMAPCSLPCYHYYLDYEGLHTQLFHRRLLGTYFAEEAWMGLRNLSMMNTEMFLILENPQF